MASCQFSVLVSDAPPSVFLLGADPLTLECGQPYRELGARAQDARDGDLTGSITVENIPDTGRLGQASIVYSVVDSSGNKSSVSRSVVVRDSVAPILTVQASPGQIWPPNHQMVPVHVSISATDACDPMPRLTLVRVTNSESPAEGDDPDVQAIIGGPTTDVLLRAERLGRGQGRIYTLTYDLADASGQKTRAATAVTVLHDKRAAP